MAIRTSLFMDPDPEQIRLAAQTGADRVELYTETYAAACRNGRDADTVFQQFFSAAEVAAEEGLGINAGHDLTVQNLPKFVANVANVLEVSIGHALIADALRQGLDATIKSYKQALEG